MEQKDKLHSGLVDCHEAGVRSLVMTIRNDVFNGFFGGQAPLRMTPGSESGRSMVEMLGVLAIAGILTIGGIAGFNYAMDRAKANDILDGVNKRAVALSPLVLLGNDIADNALDAEFGTTIGDSGVALDADNTGFDLVVSGVPKTVCDHVLNNGLKMASEILLKGEDGDDVVWAQGAKSDHTCAETDNEIVFAFNVSLDGTKGTAETGPTGNECTDTCSGGATCVNGWCKCPSGSIWQPSDNSGNGECKTGLTGDCTTNADCKEEGKYCAITGKFENYCSVPTKGYCSTLNSGTGTRVNYNGKTFLYSSGDMNWWSARNWCLAHGKSLVSLSDLSCTISGCNDWPGLQEAFGSRYLWTTTTHSYPCFMFYVATNSQHIPSNVYTNIAFAVCR